MTSLKIRFGVMADVHQDFMYRAEERLNRFIERMTEEKVDFIIQLGDFCFPVPENKPFVATWERFPGAKYHVLGNHDMDRCDKRAIMEFLGMERNYYSFDSGGYHFVVLDANYLLLDGRYVGYEHGNYHQHPEAISNLTPEQLDWLREDLAATNKPTVLFSHHNLESPFNDFNYGIKNSDELRSILREANAKAGFRKVIACLNGHNHLDGVKVIDDIYFVHINSMSYFYMGKSYAATRYSQEVCEAYPLLASTAPYEEALYAIVTLEPGKLTIEGRGAGFVGPDPVACGHRNHAGGHVVTARISDRTLLY
ncbi:metallophosphoesterase [Paenibacillus doosanensis]|uniref:metallophosphoesterase family protein n=1 Tax=Paenibacillus doosanensis TaxID=1229154 RepID=UPI00218032A7|nr:metallophosphoesterase [Paenibacillus doosanensis]MCS7463789.1 metallophosphoesterase [Paenibacillus doosanensis]